MEGEGGDCGAWLPPRPVRHPSCAQLRHAVTKSYKAVAPVESPDDVCCSIILQLTADSLETVESVVIQLKPCHHHCHADQPIDQLPALAQPSTARLQEVDLLSDRLCPLHAVAWLDENGKAPPGAACLPVQSGAVPASGQRPAPVVQAPKKTKGRKRMQTVEETKRKAHNRVAKQPTPTTYLTPRTTRAKLTKEKVKVCPGCLADDFNPSQTFTAVCRLESVRAPLPAAANDPVIFATAELQQKATERTSQLA